MSIGLVLLLFSTMQKAVKFGQWTQHHNLVDAQSYQTSASYGADDDVFVFSWRMQQAIASLDQHLI